MIIEEMKLIDDFSRGHLVASRTKKLKIVFYEFGVSIEFPLGAYHFSDIIKKSEEEAIKESIEKQKAVEHEIKLFKHFEVSLIIDVCFIGKMKMSHLKIIWRNRPEEKDNLYFDLDELKPALDLFKKEILL